MTVLELKLAAQLKCIYTNAYSLGNKQEELEAMAHQETGIEIANTEMLWMALKTGALQWMVVSSLEEIGATGVVMGWSCMSDTVLIILESKAMKTRFSGCG